MALITGLVAYWTYDESAGTTARDAQGDYHSTISGPDLNTTGKIKTCFDYEASDANNYVSITSTAFSGFSTGSVSCWFKPEAGSATAQCLWDYGDANANNYLFLTYRRDGGNDYIQVSTSSNYWIYNTGNQIMTDGSWYHLVVTHNGIAPILYINGAADTTGSFPTQNNKTKWFSGITGLDVFTTGCTYHNSSKSWYLDGCLDEVAIWNRCLTAAEVSELYNGGSGLDHSSLSRTGGTGTRWINKNYPVTSGLIAGTTSQVGRQINLVAEEEIRVWQSDKDSVQGK